MMNAHFACSTFFTFNRTPLKTLAHPEECNRTLYKALTTPWLLHFIYK